jgi:hypothetical protein
MISIILKTSRNEEHTNSKCKKIVHEEYDEFGDLLGNHLNFHLTDYADDITVFVTDKQDVEKFHSVFDV